MEEGIPAQQLSCALRCDSCGTSRLGPSSIAHRRKAIDDVYMASKLHVLQGDGTTQSQAADQETHVAQQLVGRCNDALRETIDHDAIHVVGVSLPCRRIAVSLRLKQVIMHIWTSCRVDKAVSSIHIV